MLFEERNTFSVANLASFANKNIPIVLLPPSKAEGTSTRPEPHLSFGEAVMTVFLKWAVSARIGLPDRLSETRPLSEARTCEEKWTFAEGDTMDCPSCSEDHTRDFPTPQDKTPQERRHV